MSTHATKPDSRCIILYADTQVLEHSPRGIEYASVSSLSLSRVIHADLETAVVMRVTLCNKMAHTEAPFVFEMPAQSHCVALMDLAVVTMKVLQMCIKA